MIHTTRSLLTGLAFATGLAHANYTAWTGHRDIILNTSSSGANVTGNVTKFPLLIRLTNAEAAIIGASKADGADIRFSKADDVTPLTYEIENWTPTAATIWVLVDTVYGNNATQKIRMHWGNAAATSESNGQNVFRTDNGFTGVWHMSAVSGNELDATANAHTAVAAGAPGSAAGSIGLARTLTRASSQHFTVANHATLNWTNPAVSMSAWVNANNWEGSSRIFQKGQGTDGNAAQYGMRENSRNELAIEINSLHTSGPENSVPVTGEWALIHARYNGATREVYLNGVQVLTNNYTADIVTNSDPLNIGRRPDNTNYFDGLLDELRLQHVARSNDWIRLEFQNQRAINTLVNIGSFGSTTVPGSPTGVIAVPSTQPGTINVSWAAPASNGGATIESYLVTSTPGGQNCLAEAPATTCQVIGLAAGTAYTFTVVATNSVGNSVPSAPSSPTSKILPGSFTIRTDGSKPYTYLVPASVAAATEELTMTVLNVHGKRVWSKTINPAQTRVNELTWDGRNLSGTKVAAGMYIVRIAATINGNSITSEHKGVNLK